MIIVNVLSLFLLIDYTQYMRLGRWRKYVNMTAIKRTITLNTQVHYTCCIFYYHDYHQYWCIVSPFL